MRWLFVTGIALDISGAVMVLGAILRGRPGEVAQEALSYVGYSEPRQRPASKSDGTPSAAVPC